MIKQKFALILMVSFFFMGLAIGGYDLSGSNGPENLTTTSPIVQSLETDTGNAITNSMAPQAPATQPGSGQLALYISEPPIKTDLQGLRPFDVKTSPSTNVFYDGSYLRWNGFISQFPGTSAGLWIEGSAGWSWYATMPLGGWSRELLYVPITSPIFMYDIYPSGFVLRYNLGVVQPGYYYLWYYADTPGRHIDEFSTSSGYSNKVIVDVYTVSAKPVKPVQPDPQKECEKRGFPCIWQNGACICTPAPNPVAECEKNPNCQWVGGQCLCTMNPQPIPGPVPNPVDECEKNPGCFWANGQCQCPPGPVPNPTPEPSPEPMPGPVPNPNPDDSQGEMPN